MSPTVLKLQSAVVLHGPKDLRVEERQVQVAIHSTGLCGSDLHYYQHGRNGDFAVLSPLVLGHEAAGVITALGSKIPPSLNLKVGDRVAIEPGTACGRAHNHFPSSSSDTDEDEGTAVNSSSDEEDDPDGCEFCEAGRYNLCEGMRFCSSAKTFPHLDGSLQTTMNHPAHLLHPLPESCSFERAALAEPLSVVLHAARRVGLVSHFPNASPLPLKAERPSSRSKRVLIIGTGAVGFLAAALVRTLSDLGESSSDISYIAAMDINGAKLAALAGAGYADATFQVPLGPGLKGAEQLARSRAVANDALRALSEDDHNAAKGYDIVFECTGVESCIQMAIFMARTGGKVALVGMGTPNPTLPLSSAATREVDLVGIFRYASTWPDALRLLASKPMAGVERVMVTQKYNLDDTARAFELLASGSPDQLVLKVMVGPHYP
ncbi:hypothetical protein BS47DRAFT_1339208 [Hydnum rufescens UP504]|uniref:Sorbitol dehydrogenase n=1 Tax=Hydnum rufescens UP504 TaxID=1448309 RepID=A0A9P6B4Q1_9AGAM|nr:hypothetical protein BS47DRAFT_1339208 [Hydnum rufescens UP504]